MGEGTPISRYMANKIIAVDICENLQNVFDLFQIYTINHIPVTEDGILKGIVSRFMLDNIRPSIFKTTTVDKIMTNQFVYLSSDNLVREAIEIFNTKIFDYLPVVDKNNILIGTLTPQHLVNTQRSTRHDRMKRKIHLEQ
jgi:CBS domain-containing protein